MYGQDFSLDTYWRFDGRLHKYFGKTDLWLLNPIEIGNLQPVGKLQFLNFSIPKAFLTIFNRVLPTY